MCRVERRGQRDEMTVVVEVCPGAERPGPAQEIEALLCEQVGVGVSSGLGGPGATAPLIQIAARQKPIRLIDRRRA